MAVIEITIPKNMSTEKQETVLYPVEAVTIRAVGRKTLMVRIGNIQEAVLLDTMGTMTMGIVLGMVIEDMNRLILVKEHQVQMGIQKRITDLLHHNEIENEMRRTATRIIKTPLATHTPPRSQNKKTIETVTEKGVNELTEIGVIEWKEDNNLM